MAHVDGASNCTLREPFQRQLFDGGAFVCPFLVFSVECAIGVAAFTVEFLLARGGAAVLA
jgi:hypothetical protein